jgi:hypothetical protein
MVSGSNITQITDKNLDKTPKNEMCRLLNQTSEKSFKEMVDKMTNEEILSDRCIVYLLHRSSFIEW